MSQPTVILSAFSHYSISLFSLMPIWPPSIVQNNTFHVLLSLTLPSFPEVENLPSVAILTLPSLRTLVSVSDWVGVGRDECP